MKELIGESLRGEKGGQEKAGGETVAVHGGGKGGGLECTRRRNQEENGSRIVGRGGREQGKEESVDRFVVFIGYGDTC